MRIEPNAVVSTAEKNFANMRGDGPDAWLNELGGHPDTAVQCDECHEKHRTLHVGR